MSQRANLETGQDGQIAERVVGAVAEAVDRDPIALPPLYDVIDPDAIEALFRPGTDGHVEFTYSGCDVVVEADGSVRIDGDV